ncbi:cytochrome P450 CYP12A2-like isoform X2 [Epargyreus clarus]|uniref:cytochrome P450 CYP12A2-like isoform X2 n=1 Tax=Epargyreus clarus TaxID=520877 RepID=UPI003C2ED5D8
MVFHISYQAGWGIIIGTVGANFNMYNLSKILHEKYGSVVKMEGVFSRADMVLLFEPEDFEQVYRSEDILPLRPGFETLVYYRSKMRKSIYQGVEGLTNAQGLQWRDFRTKVNPALLKPKLVKLYEPALDEIAQEMVARLVKIKDDDYLRNNFHLEMTKLSLESIGLIGLGTRLGCFQDNLSPDHPARQLMNCSKDVLDLAFKIELSPSLWKYVSTPSFKKIIKVFDLQWEVTSKFINEAQRKINERGHDIPDEDKSIIEKLLAIDEKVAIMMASDMLFAGIDTVAFTTTALLYNLATNQRAQDKLREEIQSSDQNKRYLRACLKESLRMYPVIQAQLRRTSKQHIVGDYIIPEGVDVIAPNEYLSMLEKYYPRPKEFIPERWIAEKTDPLYYGNAHPMVTLPFGFGIRMCIGRRIAELEIETFVRRLLTHLKVSWDGPPVKTVTKIMNSFALPYHFKFESVK